LITDYAKNVWHDNILIPINKYPEVYGINSVIFTYSGPIAVDRLDETLENVKIISFIRKSSIDWAEEYSYPNPNPEAGQFSPIHSHEYSDRCYLMQGTETLLLLVTFMIWGLIAVLHFTWTWVLYRQHSMCIQKLLLFLPIFFIVDNLINYVFWKACPWNGTSGENVRYLQIIQIALVTVFNTFFVGLCVFLSKGWALMRTQFTREELSSMSMIVAVFYLVYSAYFIASDIPSLKVVIVVVLSIMHLWVVFTCSVSVRKNIKILNSHI